MFSASPRTRIVTSFASIVITLCFGAQVWAYFLPRERPLLTVPRAASAPKLDGILNEACWRQAAVANQFILLGGAGFAQQQTRALLLWDESQLYLGFKCYEEHMERLVTRSTERDKVQWSDDCVEIFLQVAGRDEQCHFIATAGLSKWDAIERRGHGNENVGWNPQWAIQSARSADRWELEAAIPFAALGVQARPGQELCFNLAREEQPHSELSSYCAAEIYFPDPTYFGTLVLADTAPRITIDSWGNPLARERKLELAVRNQTRGMLSVRIALTVVGPRASRESGRSLDLAANEAVRVPLDYEIEAQGKLALICEVTGDRRTYFRHVVPISLPPPLTRVERLADELDRRLRPLELFGASYEPAAAPQPTEPWEERIEYTPMPEYYAAAEEQGFIIWKVNPWLDLDSRGVPARADVSLAELKCARGERKYVALNLRNIWSEPIDARVVPVGFGGSDAGQPSVSIHAPVFIRQHVNTDEVVADPLPRINEASVIRLAPGETTQLFLVIDTKGLKPGTHQAAIRIEPLYRLPAKEVKLPIQVAPIELAEPPVRICTWGSILGIPWATPSPLPYLEDAVAHGVNVFFVPPSFVLPKLDKQGNIIAPIDWTKHDEYVRTYSPHGLVVGAYSLGEIFDQQTDSLGIEFMSDAYRKAFCAWMTEWIAHLKSLGLDYDDFAFQLYDEPSSGKRYEQHVALGRFLRREVDPRAHVVCTTNFTDLDKLRAIDEGVDIWVPHIRTLRDPEAMAYIRATGEEIWCYVCSGYAQKLSPITYYRLLPWEAFHHGARGWGRFAHMWWGEDVWGVHGPDMAEGKTYSTIYPGPQGPVTCRRWEACYEGRQDYVYLWMVRQALAGRSAAGQDPNRTQAAAQALERWVQQVLSLIGPAYPYAIAKGTDPAILDRARLHMLQLLLELQQ
jgi:hypothetical protein